MTHHKRHIVVTRVGNRLLESWVIDKSPAPISRHRRKQFSRGPPDVSQISIDEGQLTGDSGMFEVFDRSWRTRHICKNKARNRPGRVHVTGFTKFRVVTREIESRAALAYARSRMFSSANAFLHDSAECRPGSGPASFPSASRLFVKGTFLQSTACIHIDEPWTGTLFRPHASSGSISAVERHQRTFRFFSTT